MNKPSSCALVLAAMLSVSTPALAEIATSPATSPPASDAPSPPPPPSRAYAPEAVYAPPPPAEEPVIVRKRRSLPAVYAGAGIVGVGGFSGLAGFVVLLHAGMSHADCGRSCQSTATQEKVGVGLLGGALASMAIGIPLIIWGSRKVARPFSWVGAPGASGWEWRF